MRGAAAIAGILVLLPILTTSASALVPALAPVRPTCDHDHPLVSDVSAVSIFIPASACYYAADVTIHATASLDVNGVLFPLGVHTLRLVSDKDLSIAGAVVTASGEDAATPGASGGHGGDLRVSWGIGGSFVLANGAGIYMGAGGRGGDITLAPDGSTPPTGAIVGGSGGRAGTLMLEGAEYFLYGSLIMGHGGDGGAATITGDTMGPWTATGGAGGASSLVTPSDALTRVWATGIEGGSVQGGAGGWGGEARVRGCAASDAFGGAGGSGWTGGAGGIAQAPRGATAGRGGDGIARGGDGGAAFGGSATCGPHFSTANGGDGGCASLGRNGRGGDAIVDNGAATPGSRPSRACSLLPPS